MRILKDQTLLKKLSIIIFALYIFLLIWAIMLKCNYTQSFIDTYFFLKDKSFLDRILVYISPLNIRLILRYLTDFEVILNIIVFIPFGFYLSYFIKTKKFFKIVLISFITTLFFEIFQLFSLIGAFSFIDLITNLLGGILGYLIYKLISLIKTNESKIMIANILSFLIIIAFIPVVVFALINTIKNSNLYLDILYRRLVID